MTLNDENEFKKVTTNLEFSDKISEGGIPSGKLSVIMGSSGPPKTNLIRFSPIENEKGNYMVTMSLELSDEINKKGISLIQQMLDKMKTEGIDVSDLNTVTKYERIGEEVFPVNYHSNGVITVDYPRLPFCEELRNKKITTKRPTYIDKITTFDGNIIPIGLPSGIEPIYKNKNKNDDNSAGSINK